MLDKIKQLMEIKGKMDEIKKELDSMVLTSEDSLVRVSISGSQEVRAIELKHEPVTLNKAKLEASLAETVNRAIKESQKSAAQKMSALGGFPGLG